ncbi:MAG TPA: hypothetical protein VK988_10545 [Acidimicrobiales bacterium]|nr:hypothetical protein [Acidimicrobiales bacterium]
MTEVISVEVDGEVEDGGRFSPEDRRPPRWGLPAAIAVAGVLMLAVLVMVVLPALTGAGNRPNNEAEGRRGPAETAQRRAPEAAPVDPRIDSAAKALAAWGQFAVTGDLAVLEGHFDKEGPQYRALKDEAERLVGASPGDRPYRVTLSNAAVTAADSRQATVTGTVAWSRQAEIDQAFDWELVLHPSRDGRWALWTVHDT